MFLFMTNLAQLMLFLPHNKVLSEMLVSVMGPGVYIILPCELRLSITLCKEALTLTKISYFLVQTLPIFDSNQVRIHHSLSRSAQISNRIHKYITYKNLSLNLDLYPYSVFPSRSRTEDPTSMIAKSDPMYILLYSQSKGRGYSYLLESRFFP